VSHSLTVLSLDAETNLPTDEKFTAWTAPECPLSVWSSAAVLTSQSLIVLSLDAEASVLLSGVCIKRCVCSVGQRFQ
jgi:hypothetical protein